MLPGQVFSIKLAIGSGSGYKGINITSNDGSDRIATFGIAQVATATQQFLIICRYGKWRENLEKGDFLK